MNFKIYNNKVNFEPQNLLIAGYTSKNQDELKAHVVELEKIGVAPPKKVPMIYQLSPELLSTKKTMTTVKNEGSGEAEVVLLNIKDEWYIGLGSDHTDRVLEAVSVQKSKQVCAKPISNELWKLADIEAHWDEIELKSWVFINGEEKLYQSGKLDSFLDPTTLMEIVREREYPLEGTALFCGTLPLLSEGFLYGERFRAELTDYKNNNTITLQYNAEILIDSEED